MDTQDALFMSSEGDAWFRRNAQMVIEFDGFDWPICLTQWAAATTSLRSVAELGCANGWRLAKLAHAAIGSRWIGIDASLAAIADGHSRYPVLDLHHGALHQLPMQESADLVILSFVLCYVDRVNLAAAVAEIDRVVRPGGWLIVADFLPVAPERRHYHHLPDKKVFTYKQDYAQAFIGLETYLECFRVVYDYATGAPVAQMNSEWDLAACVLLQKIGQNRYADR